MNPQPQPRHRKPADTSTAADRAHDEARRLAMWALPTIPIEAGPFLLNLPRSTFFRLLRERNVSRKKLGRRSQLNPAELRRKLLDEQPETEAA